MKAFMIIVGILTALIAFGLMIWAIADYIKTKNTDIWEDVNERCKEKEDKR